MKIPVAYELNGRRRRCLLVQDGETISVGRGAECSIRLEGDGAQETELTAQFVNGCQFVVVHPASGSVPYAQPLPWKITLGGQEMEMFRPFRPEKGRVGREIFVQGLSADELRLEWQPEQPLLLGAGPACEVVIPDAGCPEVLLALWQADGSKVNVQVMDDSVVVGWLGRAGEGEAELSLPVSLSIGGRMLLIRSAEAVVVQRVSAPVSKPVAAPAAAVLPKAPAILARSADTGPKIIARQKADAPDKPTMQAPPARVPVALPKPMGVAAHEDLSSVTVPEITAPKPYSPTWFLLFSWLLVLLIFAVALLPQRGVLTPAQLLQLWYAAGGTLMLTLLLGLGVLLK